MKLWSEVYDLVMPDLPGCPFAAVNSALRQSAIVFLRAIFGMEGRASPDYGDG